MPAMRSREAPVLAPCAPHSRVIEPHQQRHDAQLATTE